MFTNVISGGVLQLQASTETPVSIQGIKPSPARQTAAAAVVYK